MDHERNAQRNGTGKNFSGKQVMPITARIEMTVIIFLLQ